MTKIVNHILPHFAQQGMRLLYLLLLMTFGFCSQAGAALTDGLLAHYSFDDCAENGTTGTPQCESNKAIKDFSGNNHDGTIIGNVSFVYGKIGQAVEFKPYINQLSTTSDIQSDYKNAYIIVPNANNLNSNNLTVSVWVYNEKEQSSKYVTPLSIILSLSESFPAYNIEQCLHLNLAINCYTTEFVKPYSVCLGSECYYPPYVESPHSGDIYGLAYFSPSHSGNKYAFNLISSNLNQPRLYIYPSGEPKVEPKRWYHITYTYDNTTGKVRVYYNGREGAGATHKGGKALAKNVNNTVLKIGYPAVEGGFTYTLNDPFPPESSIGSEQWTSAQATNLQFEGKLDEIRIYNRILNSQEVLELYHQQPNQNPPRITKILPKSAVIDTPTIFTVTGKNLTEGMGFVINNCDGNSIEYSVGSSTEKRFLCTPRGNPINNKIKILDDIDGTVLNDRFSVKFKNKDIKNCQAKWIGNLLSIPYILSIDKDKNKIYTAKLKYIGDGKFRLDSFLSKKVDINVLQGCEPAIVDADNSRIYIPEIKYKNNKVISGYLKYIETIKKKKIFDGTRQFSYE